MRERPLEHFTGAGLALVIPAPRSSGPNRRARLAAAKRERRERAGKTGPADGSPLPVLKDVRFRADVDAGQVVLELEDAKQLRSYPLTLDDAWAVAGRAVKACQQFGRPEPVLEPVRMSPGAEELLRESIERTSGAIS
jgi:hypothetical protein